MGIRVFNDVLGVYQKVNIGSSILLMLGAYLFLFNVSIRHFFSAYYIVLTNCERINYENP